MAVPNKMRGAARSNGEICLMEKSHFTMLMVDRLQRKMLISSLWRLVVVGLIGPPANTFAETPDAATAVAVGGVVFNRDIRPILSDMCFSCHGPDNQHRQADLRLDTQEGALTVIQPNNPSTSEIILRMISHDEDKRMPPPKSTKQPTPDQIELMKRWIEQGATWQEHWSLAPLSKPAVPALAPETASAIQNPIDAFVQSQLLARGWKAAPEADRATLIRRVTLDLTGLPPTLKEVDDFVKNGQPDAYESVVKRLLQSPAFGERMAWDWLDAARYADTNGYQGDNERTMWPWRDWVVRSFNENLPFDQFTLWQLAGDMLPNATLEQKMATGFCRNHMINGEGGRIAEENRVDYVMDMTETMGTVWLGLTLNCCRCHDHKFDPIKQEEYYKLFAFFNQTPVDGKGGDPKTAPVLSIPSEDQKTQLAKLDSEIQLAQAKLKERAKSLSVDREKWENQVLAASSFSRWKVSNLLEANAHRQKMTIEKDRTILAAGENPPKDVYEIGLRPETDTFVAIRLDVLQHKSMTKNGLSRADSGNFVLTSFEVYKEAISNDLAATIREAPARKRLDVSSAKASLEQDGHKVGTVLDDDSKTGWAVWEGRVVDRPHSAVFYFSEPVQLSDKERLVVVMRHESDHVQHNIGRFRLSTSDDAQSSLEQFDPEFESAIVKKESDRSKLEQDLVVQRHHQSDTEYPNLEKVLESLRDQRKSIASKVPEVMIMAEQDKPRESFVLQRGLYNELGPKVTAGVPASLPALPNEANADRLSLARWLVSKDQPLTARVIVNRLWQQFFGVGLVKTVEDFGSQGEIPRYLELHDWLASEFRDSGWNTKQLVETIVTSSTYRQSSRFSDSAIAGDDPENRYLARGPRFRMPSWMLRDQALAASGLLVPKLGGPAVNGYQPEGVWEEATFGKKKYIQDTGESLYRRSIYTFWRRIIGPTMFFDNPSRQFCTVKVIRTNTPLQALYTFNDVTFVEAARALAVRLLAETSMDDAGRIDLAYRLVLARPAHAQEHEVLLGAIARSREQFSRQTDQANALLTIGESKAGTNLDRIELASWTTLCLAVLNLDETLTKE
jgi:hypothetical protein